MWEHSAVTRILPRYSDDWDECCNGFRWQLLKIEGTLEIFEFQEEKDTVKLSKHEEGIRLPLRSFKIAVGCFPANSPEFVP